MSAISAWYFSVSPAVFPNLVMNTSTYDTGCVLVMEISFSPFFIGVAWASTVVSALRLLGDSDGDDRTSIAVPMLFTVTATDLSTVGFGNCSIKPTPVLKPGNGSASRYRSVFHAVAGSPSIASFANSGWSGACPPGE